MIAGLSCQEFAKVVEPENVKQDLIPLFHNLASDEQVRGEGKEGKRGKELKGRGPRGAKGERVEGGEGEIAMSGEK